MPQLSKKMQTSSRNAIALVPITYRKSSLFSPASWQPAKAPVALSTLQPSATSTHGTASARLSILTYNVWFDNLAVAYRYPALIDLFCRSGADVVCLQEVTNTFIGYLLTHEAVRKTYDIIGLDRPPDAAAPGAGSSASGRGTGHAGTKAREGYRLADGMRYGCLILLNRHTTCLSSASPPILARFPGTRQDRRLLSVSLSGRANAPTAGLESLRIATAHFESPHTAHDSRDSPQLRAREAQMRYAKDALSGQLSGRGAGMGMAVVCGDTNIHVKEEEAMPERLGYVDAWLSVHPEPHSGSDPGSMGSVDEPTRGRGVDAGRAFANGARPPQPSDRGSTTDLRKESCRAGYTFPTSYALPNFDQSIESRRLDRVLLLGSPAVRAVKADVLGMQERVIVPEAGGMEVPLSDHGALLVHVGVELALA